MSNRLIVPAVLGALALGAVPALAAVGADHVPPTQAKADVQHVAARAVADRCTRFENLFDAEFKHHQSDANAPDAKALRAEGGALCATGKNDQGVAKLQTALHDILGVTPRI